MSMDDQPRARRGAIEPEADDTAMLQLTGVPAAKSGNGTSAKPEGAKPEGAKPEGAKPEGAKEAGAPTGKARHGDGFAGKLLRVVEMLLAAAVVAAGVYLVGLLPTAQSSPAPQDTVTSSTLYCPGIDDVSGTVTGAADSGGHLQPVGSAALAGGSLLQQPVTGVSTLSGVGSVAGMAEFSQPGKSAAAACTSPMSTGYLQAGTANSTLMLSNVDADNAILNVALLAPSGEIAPPDLIDLTVPAGTVKEIPLSTYASGVSPLAVRWQSTVGRVVAWIVTNDPSGLDLVSPTRSGDEVVVPGVPGGATVKLLLTNPATVRVQVRVDALTSQGRLTIAGAEQVTIEAGSTTSVDLTSTFSSDPAGLIVTSDQPVVASAWVTVGSDTATSPGLPVGQSAGLDSFGVTPDRGQLLISNAGENTTSAVVTFTPKGGTAAKQTVQLPAGVTASVALPSAGLIRVSGGPGIVAAVVAQPGGDGANGTSIVTLPSDTARAGLTPIWVEGQPL